MADFFGFLIALLMIPIILLVVLLSLAAAGVGIAIGLATAILGVGFSLAIWALPYVLVGGLIYWLFFRSSRGRGVAHD
jgi:hypothetical protein